MLNFALQYLKKGLSVIPLRPRGKEPLIPWTEFQTRRASEEEIKAWWTKWPVANIGVVTGSISGVAVVDLDGPEGIKSAQELNLHSKVTSNTGNGKHLWFRVDTKVLNTVRTLPGIDIRGDGGFVVVPPSLHESGRRYRWLNPLRAIQTLPMFPTVFANTAPAVVSAKEESWIAKALEDMKNGNIDDTLFTICSRLRADNWSSRDALVLLEPHAKRVGASPGHLEEKIENVWNRYPAGHGDESHTKGHSDVNAIRPITSGDSGQSAGLVIHSPANSESWALYSKRSNTDMDKGIRTGYRKLDEMLHGGLKSSRLFTVAARTGTGKTNWLIAVAKEICRSGRSVLLFSTEMPYQEIWARYLATIKDPEEFKRHKFYVCDSFSPNLEKVEAIINEIKPDVFMFDHINHVSEEQRELGTFMQGLNFLRRKYDCAGIVTAQLNRSADWVDLKTGEKVTPRMSMIKGSGTIEQASSRVLLLSETRVTPECTEIVGNLDKNDNGPKGILHFGLMTNPYRMIQL